MRLFSIAFGFVNLNYNVKSTQTTTSSALATVTRDEGTLVYDNGQLPQLQKVGMQFYQIMAEFYHMNVNFPEGKAAGWTVELSSKARERWLPVWSVYPRVVNGCGK